MNDITVTTNNGVKEYVDFNLFTMNKLYKMNVLILLFVVLAILFIILGYLLDGEVTLYGFGFILLFVGVIFRPLFIYNVKKMVQGSSLLNMNGDIRFTKEGIDETTEISSTHLTWDRIVSIDETADMIYVYISKVQAILLQRTLLTDDELNQIKEWASMT